MYTRIPDSDPNTMWTLVCNIGYAPADLSAGILKICDGRGGFLPPVATPCQAAEGCTIDLESRNQSTCFNGTEYMAEGASCTVVCPWDHKVIGSFTCSFGELIGEAMCLSKESAQNLQVVSLRGIAVTIEMRIDGCLAGIGDASCASVLQMALAQTLGTTVRRVVVRNGRICISSTTAASCGQSPFSDLTPSWTASTAAPPRRESLAGNIFNVSFTALAFPTSSQSTIYQAAILVQQISGLGVVASREYDTLNRTLVSTASMILGSARIVIAPRPFDTSVAVSLASGVTQPDGNTVSEEGQSTTFNALHALLIGVAVVGCMVGALLFFCISLQLRRHAKLEEALEHPGVDEGLREVAIAQIGKELEHLQLHEPSLGNVQNAVPFHVAKGRELEHLELHEPSLGKVQNAVPIHVATGRESEHLQLHELSRGNVQNAVPVHVAKGLELDPFCCTSHGNIQNAVAFQAAKGRESKHLELHEPSLGKVQDAVPIHVAKRLELDPFLLHETSLGNVQNAVGCQGAKGQDLKNLDLDKPALGKVQTVVPSRKKKKERELDHSELLEHLSNVQNAVLSQAAKERGIPSQL